MTKSEMIDQMAADLNMPKAQVRRMVDSFVDSVVASLKNGKKVQLSGLGVFDVRKRAARTGRNPQTGEAINIPARNAVGFRAAKSLRDAVN